MKKNIHPKLHTMKVIDANGDEITLLSTSSRGKCEISTAKDRHHAWNRQAVFVQDSTKKNYSIGYDF